MQEGAWVATKMEPFVWTLYERGHPLAAASDDLFISVLESDSRATRESDDLQGYWQWRSRESSCFWQGVDVVDLADFSQSFASEDMNRGVVRSHSTT